MDAELNYFEQARTFADNKGPINSIDFHRSEDLVVTAGACVARPCGGGSKSALHMCPWLHSAQLKPDGLGFCHLVPCPRGPRGFV
jgi:hypothetical protein